MTVWPLEYLNKINSGEEVVSNKVKIVYERECEWIVNPPADFPYYFDPELGQHHITFMERFCKHSKGKWAGRSLEFELFQRAKLQLVFGWIEKKSNLRRFREVDDIRGRKCGKSTETAAVAWDMALNDHEMGAEIYCTANKLDQAKIIFNECANMRKQSNALASVSKKRQSDIYIEMSMSILKALASDTSTMDGLNTSFFSQDEFHEQRNRKLYDVMIQSLSAREQPLAWLISTNGFVREAFFDEIYNYASNVALWLPGFEDYTLLPLIYELDNRKEWTDPKCWAKANPGLGRVKKISTLAGLVEKAKRDPSVLPTLLTKDFNIPENSTDAWIPFQSTINENVVDMEYLRNSYAVGGCDLSSTTDLTCATLLLKKPKDDNFYVLQKYFIPKSKADRAEDNDKREAPYKKWAEMGLIELSEGATVDFHAVTNWFIQMVKVYNIRPLWIGYDAALSGYWREEMDEKGFTMEKLRQGPFTWTYPFKELAGKLEEHKIVYQNNPVLRWCLQNTGKKSMNTGGIESQQPVKVTSTRRIDGTVSLLNAYTSYKNHEDEYKRFIK